MKRSVWTGILAMMVFAAGTSYAMMGGGMGQLWGGSHMGGLGYGMGRAGGVGTMSGMMDATLNEGYLEILNPVDTQEEALEAVQRFLYTTPANLRVSELWEYETVYKAELADIYGEKAFDLLVDKFTGAVLPEMGFSMMMNARWGKAFQKTPTFGRTLRISPEEARAIAQAFIDDNGLGYTLQDPEVYPGFYKFHTTDPSADGGFGLDIMVSGFNGRIWMDTILGVPLGPPVVY